LFGRKELSKKTTFCSFFFEKRKGRHTEPEAPSPRSLLSFFRRKKEEASFGIGGGEKKKGGRRNR
jgi:hypothetical protein